MAHHIHTRTHGCVMQALCTEASLVALRRSYPQIYASDDKLLVDPRRVSVHQQDFEDAFRSITPASGRSVASPARYVSSLLVCTMPELQQGSGVGVETCGCCVDIISILHAHCSSGAF